MCGDVTMAGDVLKAVQSIVRQQGRLSAEEAGAFLSKLRVSRVHLCHGDGGSREAGNEALRSSSGISKKKYLRVKNQRWVHSYGKCKDE